MPENVKMNSRETKLALEYGSKREPSEILQKILDNPRDSDLLYQALKRTLFCVIQRSSALEHHESTIYDRLLLEMWNVGNLRHNVALLDLFLDKYVIIKNSHDAIDSQIVVTAYLNARKSASINLVTILPKREPSDLPSSDEVSDLDTTYEASADSMGNKTTLDGPRQAEATRVKDEALDKLIQVYHAAKADYYLSDANKTGISDKSTDKFTNVRFLRDTAENLLRCLTAQKGDHHLMPEVERVVAASCEHAERLAGGRKRIFEDPEDEQQARHRNTRRHNQENKTSPYPSRPPSTYQGTRFEPSKRARTFQSVDRYRGEAYKEDWQTGRPYERPERTDRGHGRGHPIREHYRRGHPAVRDHERPRAEPADYAVKIERAGDTHHSGRDDRSDRVELIERTEPFDRRDEGYNGSD